MLVVNRDEFDIQSIKLRFDKHRKTHRIIPIIYIYIVLRFINNCSPPRMLFSLNLVRTGKFQCSSGSAGSFLHF